MTCYSYIWPVPHCRFVPTSLPVRIQLCSASATDQRPYFKRLRVHIQKIVAAVVELMCKANASKKWNSSWQRIATWSKLHPRSCCFWFSWFALIWFRQRPAYTYQWSSLDSSRKIKELSIHHVERECRYLRHPVLKNQIILRELSSRVFLLQNLGKAPKMWFWTEVPFRMVRHFF